MKIFCLILAVLLCMNSCSYAFTLKQSIGYKAYNKAVLIAHNKARTDPKYFADLISKETQKFVYDESGKITNDLWNADDFVSKTTECYDATQTEEGIAVWQETIKYLNEFNIPLKGLIWSESLAQAWYDHTLDQGPKGTDGHQGSDGKWSEDRIYKYIDSDLVGENLEYSDVYYPEDPIMRLLIDDGFKTRGHRHQIMDAEMTHVGINWGCHKQFIEMCCFAYGQDIVDNTQNFVANASPQLDTCVNYTPSTKDETSGLYTLSSITTAPLPPVKPTHKKTVEIVDNCTINSDYFVGGVTRVYDFKIPARNGKFTHKK